MAAIVRGWPWCEWKGELYFGGNHHIRYADRSTFEVLSEWWARDYKRVYRAGSAIRGADPTTFTVLNELYAKDANRAYTMVGPIKEADVSTFTAIGDTQHSFGVSNGYAKDSRAVYHTTLGEKEHLMKAADPATFAPLGNGYGADSKNVFYEDCKLPGARPDDWAFIGGPHSRSGKYAYHFHKRIPGANGDALKSLPILDSFEKWCRDDNGFFKGTSPADPEEYFDDFRKCFVSVGRVDHVKLTCYGDDEDDEGDTEVSVDEPDAWMIADHACIYVTPSQWLQRPSVPGVIPPETGEPVWFGEALQLHLLSKGNWMNEERIWMLQPTQDQSSVEPRFFFTCVDAWWQYLHLGALGLITDLIAEAQTT